MSDKRLFLSCYRALLRWSARCGEAPLRVKVDHLREVCPAIPETHDFLVDSGGLRSLVRWRFRKREPKFGGGEEPVTQAFAALKLLNTHYEPLLQELVEERKAHTDRQGVLFHVGEVVQHSQKGYGGVVTGWDRVCGNISLVEHPDVDLVQPFYKVVTDSVESANNSKSPFRYLAQEELKSMKNKDYVIYRKIDDYFEGYSARLKRFIPKKHIQWEFPDDYVADDIQPCWKVNQKTQDKPASGMQGTGKVMGKTRQRKKDKVARRSDGIEPQKLPARLEKPGPSAVKNIPPKQRGTSRRKEATTLEGRDHHH